MPENGNPYSEDDPVVAQYERWAYPPPTDDLTKGWGADYVRAFRALEGISPIYWPAGKPREHPDTLIAGCGTLAAACCAYVYPNRQVVGIDISRSSLACEQRLKERYGLSNLTLHRCPVEEVATLGRDFDFISCHGVLHHLPDPTAGLRALGKVLRTDGAIAIMLYAKYGREQVYRFQELFRLLGLGQTPQDADLVRQTLASLPAEHPLRQYLSNAKDIADDAGLVDTFLHRRDRPYTVRDCLDLVRDAGLAFQGWEQNVFYYPDNFLCRAPAVRDRINALPEEQMWEAMEMLAGRISTHWFVACRPERDPATYRIPWESRALFECVPLRAASVRLIERRAPGKPSEWGVGSPSCPIPLTAQQAAICAQIDGSRTLGQCIAAAKLSVEPETGLRAGRELLRLLWRTGFGAVRLARTTEPRD